MEQKPLRFEHPRPDRERSAWQTLNGAWHFGFDRENVGRRDKWYRGAALPLTIEVPFAYQSELSGVKDKEHCDVIWYARKFTVSGALRPLRRLLHFGAADYRADVWLDGQYLGGHEGGYTPFSFDVTDLTEEDKAYTLYVRCEDRLDFDQPRGKQSFRPEPFACWYTPMSGLWQSVWLEGVGEYYPVDFRLTPRLQSGSLYAELTLNELPKDGFVRLTASFKGVVAAKQEVAVTTDRLVRAELFLRHNELLEGFHTWHPDHPDLYDLTIETGVNGVVRDTVKTYFGMRDIRVVNGYVLLNNSPFTQRLILDQGYWPDGLLTAPSDDALRRDVELTIRMGYNGARKHQKFEDPRYLYWADRLGLVVWGELPSAYWLTDREKRGMMRDLSEAIARDYNHPCLIAWATLNESWGVPFIETDREAGALSDLLYHLVHSLDGTRLVSGNDGWENAATDLFTVHDYTAWPEQLHSEYATSESMRDGAPDGCKLSTAVGYDHHGKPMLLTEYGGIAMQKDSGGDNWGYNGAAQDEESFLKRFEAITAAVKHLPACRGYCYTQLTDVFQEVNGLLDMNRNPKVSMDEIKRINLQD